MDSPFFSNGKKLGPASLIFRTIKPPQSPSWAQSGVNMPEPSFQTDLSKKPVGHRRPGLPGVHCERQSRLSTEDETEYTKQGH
jgi:hypothetical protein